MTPSRQEIEAAIGQRLDPNTPINEVNALPSPQEQAKDNFMVRLLGKIKDKCSIFAKTKLGVIIEIYLLFCGLGFPLSSPYEIMVLAADQFQQVAPLVFNYLDSHASDAIGYLVSLPPEYTQQQFGPQITWDTLPTGSGVYPLSADIQMKI